MRAFSIISGIFAIAASAMLAPASAQSCPSNLSHLASKLPQYNHPSLQQARAAVLGEDLNASYKRMRASGMSPAQAAAEAVKSSQSAEQQRIVAQECIRQVSTNPDATISELENGSYSFSDQGILESCAANYVLMYYMAVGMKEVAIAVACNARS